MRACCGSRWDEPGPSTATAPVETLDGVVETTSNPTSVAFGGTDRGDLYITTSWSDLEADTRAAQPLAGVIFRCRPGVTGPPSPPYAGLLSAPAPWPEHAPGLPSPEKGGTP